MFAETKERLIGKIVGCVAHLYKGLIVILMPDPLRSPDIVEVLCSYFFDDPIHLFSIENPRKGEVTDTWTTKEVKGKKIIDVPVNILISEKTFSAA